MLFVLNNIWSITIGIIVAFGFYFFPEIYERWLTLFLTSIGLGVFVHYINFKGQVKFGSWFFIIALWLLISIPILTAGGIRAPGIITQVSVILTAGFLLGSFQGLIFGVISILFNFFLVYLEITNKLPKAVVQHTPITLWIGSIIPFGTIIALQYYATNHLRASLKAIKRENDFRIEAEKQKDKTYLLLNERVKELKGLFAVSQVLQQNTISVDAAMQQIILVLPEAWQFPAYCAVSISVDKKVYQTKNYGNYKDKLQFEKYTNQNIKIKLEVVYTKEFPASDIGPFLKEEQALLNTLADLIQVFIERKEYYKELNDYKNAINSATIVSITDEQDKFVYVSDNFCELTKYSKAEILGQHWGIIASGLQPTSFYENITQQLLAGKYFRGEFCNKNKYGKLYWLDATVVPFLNDEGQLVKVLTIGQDITEKKLSADKLIKSEEFLRRTTSHVPGNTYVFTIDETGHLSFIFTNRGKEPFNHTLSTRELIENPELLLNKIHEDDRMKFRETILEAQRSLRYLSVQYRLNIKGVVRWRWMQAYPVRNHEGVIEWYGSSSDITPLVDYIVSIEQFIFDLSHVIRKPIANLMGLTDIIKNGNLSDSEIKDFCKDIYKSSNELDLFVRALHGTYIQKKENSTLNIDFETLMDRRSHLFN